MIAGYSSKEMKIFYLRTKEMKNFFFEGILDKLSSFCPEYRFIRAFYQHFPQQGADYGAYAAKISLLDAFAQQRVAESKLNDAGKL